MLSKNDFKPNRLAILIKKSEKLPQFFYIKEKNKNLDWLSILK